MKNTIKVIILSLIMLFCIINFTYANSISISSDKDLTNILPGEEFKVKVKLNSDENLAAVQCKLEFDNNKLEIIKDEAYEELAKIEVGTDIENVTATADGKFIINTIKGTSPNNEFEINFRVKENAKFKNDKIVLKKVDSTIELDKEESYLAIGKQSEIDTNMYYIIMIIVILVVIVIILVLLILILKNKRKR